MRLFTITTAFALLIGSSIGVNAQDKMAKKSPMQTTEANVGDAKVTISYSAPSVRGRTIYGELVPFGKVWRTGANEATTIETSADITIGGENLKAGKYSLFSIPGKDGWTVIINSVSDQWGAYKYSEDKDVLRVDTDKIEMIDNKEQFEIMIDNGMLSFVWATTKVSVSIK